MSTVENLVHTPIASALGWTLFHSLWEGAVIALVLLIALSIIRASRLRYAAACLAMLCILAGFALTFFRFLPGQSGASAVVTRTLAQPPAARLTGISVPLRISAVLPWLTPFWIAGVMLFYWRNFASWLGARRLRESGVCRAPEEWQQHLTRLRTRLRLHSAVGLLESSLAEVPAVIGHLRPVILLPVGLLAGMPASQIEAILLHELAHVRRRDYLVNLLQMVVEGFLFYHPAVWWISRVIRTERENCCDDLVVAVNGDAHEYAVALTTLEENRGAANQAVLAANGGPLMNRIRRLLFPRETSRGFLAPVFSAGLLTLITALALIAWQSKPADPFATWLDVDAAYIITPQERAAFNKLQTNDERELFVEQFWLRRDPTPDTPENEFKDEHYRRMSYASRFISPSGTPGWKTDRGRIYITFGPPDEIDSHPGGSGTKAPYEDWLYRFIDGIGNNVSMEFAGPELRMTTDPSPGDAIRR